MGAITKLLHPNPKADSNPELNSVPNPKSTPQFQTFSCGTFTIAPNYGTLVSVTDIPH